LARGVSLLHQHKNGSNSFDDAVHAEKIGYALLSVSSWLELANGLSEVKGGLELVWYGVVPLLTPHQRRSFAEGGGVMQRLSGQKQHRQALNSALIGRWVRPDVDVRQAASAP
jgi:hypothetical protein